MIEKSCNNPIPLGKKVGILQPCGKLIRNAKVLREYWHCSAGQCYEVRYISGPREQRCPFKVVGDRLRAPRKSRKKKKTKITSGMKLKRKDRKQIKKDSLNKRESQREQSRRE